MYCLYRSLIPDDETDLKNNIVPPKTGLRVPKYVPTYIDNIWEWTRPENFPSRRKSVFASPTIELAKSNGPKNGIVYQVVPLGTYKLCQLTNVENASVHPDCEKLRSVFCNLFGNEWQSQHLDGKVLAERLFLPCLSAQDVESIFEDDLKLKTNKRLIQKAVTIWKSSTLVDFEKNDIIDEVGELFFESSQGFCMKVPNKMLLPDGQLLRPKKRPPQ